MGACVCCGEARGGRGEALPWASGLWEVRIKRSVHIPCGSFPVAPVPRHPGDSHPSLGPRDPARGGTEDCGARGAGGRAPTARLADRCRFLLGRGAPCLCLPRAPRGRPCQPPASSPSPEARRSALPRLSVPGREGGRQLRASARVRPGPGRGEAGMSGPRAPRPESLRAPAGPGPRPRVSAGRRASRAFPRASAAGGAPGRLPRLFSTGLGGAGRQRAPRPAPAPPRPGPRRRRPGRREEAAAPRELPAAPGARLPAPARSAPGKWGGREARRGAGGRGPSPRPSRGASPRDQAAESRGDLGERAGRGGGGPGVTAAGGRIFLV